MAHVLTQPAPRAASFAELISRHLPSRDQLLRSEAVWLVLMAYLAAAKILNDTVVPITFRSSGQVGLFSWSGVVTYVLLGLVGMWCARATGFPAAWDVRISTRQRLLIPIALGIAIGVAEVGIDVVTAGTRALAQVTGPPSFNIDFPGSLLAYSGGAFEVETLYRLFSLPFLVWLISSVVLRGRGQWPTLLVIGALAAGSNPSRKECFCS
jgi:hypothetical protein